jgi:hypothetical protein
MAGPDELENPAADGGELQAALLAKLFSPAKGAGNASIVIVFRARFGIPVDGRGHNTYRMNSRSKGRPFRVGLQGVVFQVPERVTRC